MSAKDRFITIPPKVLRGIDQGKNRLPFRYYYSHYLLRNYFWSRLRIVARMLPKGLQKGSVLDLGGGSGVLLPTLSTRFRNVYCVDLSTEYASFIRDHYRLPNIILAQENILVKEYEKHLFDVIIAADVLEHFRDLTPVIEKLVLWLKPGGTLMVSAPLENALQRFGRKILRLVPPADHFYTAVQIEKALCEKGFEGTGRVLLPSRFLAIQSISSWRYHTSAESKK